MLKIRCFFLDITKKTTIRGDCVLLDQLLSIIMVSVILKSQWLRTVHSHSIVILLILNYM